MLDENGDGQISKLEAIRAETIKLREQWVTNANGTSTYTSTGGATASKPVGGTTTTITDTTSATYTTADVVAFVNQQLAANNPLAIYTEAVRRGISSTSLDRIMGWAAGTSLNWAKANNLPSFSVGGYTGPGGVNEFGGIVHKGEVVWSQSDIARAGGVNNVQALRAGAVPMAVQTRADQRSDPVLRQLVADLTEQVANLRIETRAGVSANQEHLAGVKRMTRNFQAAPIVGMQNDPLKVQVLA
jgi:hypothetical protein